MALQKSILLQSGIEANYFKIVQTTRNYERNELVVELAGYVDWETRLEYGPITSIRIVLPLDMLPETRDNVYSMVEVYSELDENGNELNPLKGAVDC